ncbi:MAG: LEA type 2 family protein [Bacteroidia bacterium]|nr:LEA type 2 family protein [Bacteroidia bacterium]
MLIVLISVVVLYLVFNPGKALNFVFPELNKISYLNSVIRKDSVFTTVSMLMENKNPYKLNIDTFHFEVWLNDTCIAHETVFLGIRQKRGQADTVKLPLRLNGKKIRTLIKNLQSKDSTNAEIRGYVLYETFLGDTKLKFDRKVRIEVPVPPEIKISKIERKKFNYGDNTLDAVAHIQVRNMGKKLSLHLMDVHYDLTVKNTLHSEGIITEDAVIAPQSVLNLNVPMRIEVFHPLKTVWLIRTDQDRLDYTLNINGLVNENMSERSFTGRAEIEASGKMELVR